MASVLFVIIAVSCQLLADDASGPKTYLLQYKLKAGEQIHYEVTHVAKTKTRVSGSEDISQMHTVSKRHWDVKDDSSANMTFDHVIDSVEMTQQNGDQKEVRWSSDSQQKAPEMFKHVASRIGEKISSLTVDSSGNEVAREDFGASKASLGMGSLTLALPQKSVELGSQWTIPREVKARTEDGLVKPIKIREVYTLEKVKTGVATISLRSEPITPIYKESIRAQVLQQLSNGEIRFDIDNGRMLSKQLDWDETVVGFQGDNSLMEYRARMTERLIETSARTARITKRPN